MKFHCDSCNTRYSIADERVRGKVLKIRCKSCSAVISVRHDVEPAGANGVGSSDDAANGDIEWYMSIDGKQTGPMKLPQARVWLAKQSPDVSVYCWYNGFGDWKPVEDVDAFARSLPKPRSAPSARVPSRPAAPRSSSNGADNRAATEVPTLRAASERVAGSARLGSPVPKSARDRMDGSSPGTYPRGASPAPLPAIPTVSSVAKPKAPTPLTPTPLTPTPLTPTPLTPTPAPLTPTPPPTLLEPPLVSSQVAPVVPVTPAAPTPSKPTTSDLPGTDLSPAAADTAAKMSDSMFPEADDDLDIDISEPSRVVKLDVLMASRQVGGAAQRAGGGGLPGVRRATGAVQALQAQPSRPNTVDPSFSELAAELEEDALDALPPPRRRGAFGGMLAIVILLALVAGALVVVVLRSQDKSEEERVATGSLPSDFENLGRRVDGIRVRVEKTGPGTTNGTASDNGDAKTSKVKKVRNSTRKTPRTDGTPKKASGSQTNGTNGGNDSNSQTNGSNTQADALTPLSPDDVIRQSSRSQISFKRCYERAKKKDPFLEVRSLKIDIKVGSDGKVSSVGISGTQDAYLTPCLKGTVRRWKFRPSTEGIASQIALEFER